MQDHVLLLRQRPRHPQPPRPAGGGGGTAAASALAAVLNGIIDALAIATACAVIGTAAFCGWRVRVLTRSAPEAPAPGLPIPGEPARALPAPARLAIEPPLPQAGQPFRPAPRHYTINERT